MDFINISVMKPFDQGIRKMILFLTILRRGFRLEVDPDISRAIALQGGDKNKSYNENR